MSPPALPPPLKPARRAWPPLVPCCYASPSLRWDSQPLCSRTPWHPTTPILGTKDRHGRSARAHHRGGATPAPLGRLRRGGPEQAGPSLRDGRRSLLSSPAKDDGSGGVKAAGPDPDWLAAATALPPPVLRPPEKKIYSCSECGKEYASRSGLKSGLHAPAAEYSPAPSAPPAPAPASTTNSGPVSFWNQYQVFLTNSNDQPEDPVPNPANGSQAEEVEMPRLAKSPEKPQPSEDQAAGTGLEELREESKGGAEPEAM
ncbi:hypothetical protein ANANG_G00169210 [Anguilla anguilla]|uniref:C2H2-type domain-containing protein n=1 Tax=Anguilla anguilla TaxID=7936 RepID=A0A9D3RW81_ANGAN|nr:hypothetical protein ANANG_G00169210 [Anguilla anguilla]